MNFTSQVSGDTIQIKLNESLSGTDKTALAPSFEKATECSQRIVEFNLSGISVISSSNIGEFIILEKKLRKQNRQLVFVEVESQLNDIFECIYLSKIITIKPKSFQVA